MNTYRIIITQIDEQGNETAWNPERIRACNGFALLLMDKEADVNDPFNLQIIIEGLNVLHLASAINENCYFKRAAKLALMVDAPGGTGKETEEESEET